MIKNIKNDKKNDKKMLNDKKLYQFVFIISGIIYM